MLRRALFTLGFILLLAGWVALPVTASPSSAAAEIFQARCAACHGAAKQGGGLRLDSLQEVLKGGDSGPVIASDPVESEIWRRLTDEDPARRMPPGGSLQPSELAQIRAWLSAGAPAEGAPPAPRRTSSHWAFQPVQDPAPPGQRAAAADGSSIDAFIRARLSSKGLKLSEEADRYTLLRRVSLDLTGLPPLPAEIETFLTDTRPGAYERAVDRLLASPQYGEKWARHWLDLARYADSNGFTIDSARSIWKYRDWVIDALNRDLPYDRFVIEQLAGDLLPGAGEPQLIATGFHRNTLINEEGGTDQEQFRVEAVVDRVNTTGSVFLGLTVGCAQCHTHKYDPITQREYYQLFAFFNNQDEPVYSSPTPEQKQRLRELEQQVAQSQAELKQIDSSASGKLAPAAKAAAVVEARAASGRLASLPDGSVKLEKDGGADDFDLVLQPAPGRYTALQLEALTDASLPSGGPGMAGGNFILSEVELQLQSGGGKPKQAAFSGAVADHSQPKYPAYHAVDRDPTTGWAINTSAASPGEKLNSPRTALFLLAEPVQIEPGDRLLVRLSHSGGERRYVLGRFRLSMISQAPAELGSLLSPAAASLAARPPGELKQAEQEYLKRARAENLPASAAARLKLHQRSRALAALKASIPTTLILRERSEPRVSNVHLRGDFLRKGAVVEPGTPEVLPPLQPRGAKADRLDLARWIVSPKNPLAGRVAVNRAWQAFFGRGLVETENDWGLQGAAPSHPELLDWLTRRFIEGAGGGAPYSMKALHRLIVTSATYRQSSRVRRDLQSRDPENRLLGRQSRIRLEAELVRDAALRASGLLSSRLGGPSVFPPQPAGLDLFTQSKKNWRTSEGENLYRRGLYTFAWRSSPYAFFAAFDAPNGVVTCTRRGRSNTPVGALMMANDDAMLEMARALGSELARQRPASTPLRIRHLFLRCLGRPAQQPETEAITAFLHAQLQHYRANRRESAALTDDAAGDAELAAWTAAARAVMNLDEFITRE